MAVPTEVATPSVAEVRKQIVEFETFSDGISFWAGSPGSSALHGCNDLLLEASNKLLHKDSDLADLFMYGETQGCKEFRNQLAKYLTKEYGETIESSDLMITAGATQGLHLITTLLIQTPCPIFIEDPTYYFGFRMLRDDLKRDVVPVPCDDDGMCVDMLEKLIKDRNPENYQTTPDRPYWAAVYLIPVFHNPTGMTYTKERCQKLVQLARKYGLLLIAEDVYNLLHYSDNEHAPPRLIAYDKPTDPDYGKGHVMSNATFSKILAPSLRLGWLEGPPSVISFLSNSNYAWSGGSFNHFTAKLITEVIRSGSLENHVNKLRQLYKERMSVLCKTLKENLPQGCSFVEPQGGFFLWIRLPKEVNTLHFMKFAASSYEVVAMPGICCSPTDQFGNCLRLSISVHGEEAIRKGAAQLCAAVKEYIQTLATAN